MGKILASLNLYLDAELGIHTDLPMNASEIVFIDQSDEQDFSDDPKDDNSQET